MMINFVTIMTLLGVYSSADTDRYDKYGGWTGLKSKATSFFRTENINGTWWLINPEGNAFISKGVNHVSFTADNAPSLGYSPYERITSKKYGDAHTWARTSIQRLKDWNFNTIGAWSNGEMFDKDAPYTLILNIGASAGGSWLNGAFPDVFSEEFQNAAENQARKLCATRANDPFLLGYFLDNELRWGPDWRSQNTLFDDFLAMPENATGKKVLVNMLKELYGDIDKLNSAWHTNCRGFEDILAAKELSDLGKEMESVELELSEVQGRFLKLVAEQYFKVCRAAIKKFDKNHLILGCRYAGYAPTEVVEGMKNYIDVVSYNNYDKLPPKDRLEKLYEIVGKPIMITEFSFKAMDSGLPNTKGAGQPVETQKDRADNFTEYVQALMAMPFAVGYHWFEYADEPAEGRFDGENSNYGLVNIKDEPWKILVEKMTKVNGDVERVHSSKCTVH